MEDKMKFEEAIGEFRGKEEIEDTSCLFSKGTNSDSLRRIVVAWNKIKITRLSKKKASPPGEHDLWKWMWEQVSYDEEELKRVSGVRVNLNSLVEILKGNRLIYPDGTISSFAQTALKMKIKTELGI
jgi:hypothetical protein